MHGAPANRRFRLHAKLGFVLVNNRVPGTGSSESVVLLGTREGYEVVGQAMFTCRGVRRFENELSEQRTEAGVMSLKT